MGIFKKTKKDLQEGLDAVKKNKKLRLENEELQKRLKKYNEEKEKEINQLKTEELAQKKNNSNYHAKVRLYLTSGTNREKIAELGAFFGHKEGKQTLKVINKDKEVIFEEIKPDWQNVYNYSDEETLKKKIKDLKSILNKFQNGEIIEKKDSKSNMIYYEEDYMAMLREAEQKYAIKVLGAKGTYSEMEDGIPVYFFDIIGFFKIPMFFYTDKSILGIPPAAKIVAGQYILDALYRDKHADETKAERIAMVLAIIGSLIMIITSAYFYYKQVGGLEIMSNNLNLASQNLANLLNYSDSLNQISNQINTTNSLLQENVINKPIQNLTTIVK